MKPNFYTSLAVVLNSGQSRSVVVSGNINDLFWDGKDYIPLISFLLEKTRVPEKIVQIVYELNAPIRVDEVGKQKLCEAWIKFKTGYSSDDLFLRNLRAELKKKDLSDQADAYKKEFEKKFEESQKYPAVAMEFLRQLCLISRTTMPDANLVVIIEAADMLVPAADGANNLTDAQLHRISILQDWFTDPDFVNGGDSVILLAESRSLLHSRISRMPQVMNVEVPSPDYDDRRSYIEYVCNKDRIDFPEDQKNRLSFSTAGLSIYALRQILKMAAYRGVDAIDMQLIVQKVEEYIKSQVGEDVVEFKKPSHNLSDVVGARKIVNFVNQELIPRFRDGSLSGCIVSGPIGGGKTYIFEAVSAELDMPVMVLKNLRSKWFGETDVIFERLRRVLEALDKVAIFVDEADTQFGGVDSNTHETERRLTGKIQAMMSDTRLKGKVIWILMTARIHLLSPDIRRPGRGDLIIPILDPVGEDRKDFIRWVLKGLIVDKRLVDDVDKLLPEQYSAASFALLRSHLKAHKSMILGNPDLIPSYEQQNHAIRKLVDDLLLPNIEETREYQTLQALVNTTRSSLLPELTEQDLGGFYGGSMSEKIRIARSAWQKRIRTLEDMGIR